jgi:hypothetical protein
LGCKSLFSTRHLLALRLLSLQLNWPQLMHHQSLVPPSHPPGALLRSTPQVLQTFEDDACSQYNVYKAELSAECCCMAHVVLLWSGQVAHLPCTVIGSTHK